MEKMMSTEFLCKIVALTNTPTLYVMGCFGAPMKYRERYIKAQSYNQRADRSRKMREASDGTFGFDCVCMIKGVLWGFCADSTDCYGGAEYAANGVPDIDTEGMINKCKDKTDDFSEIQPGELVWIPGHVGVYVGNNEVVECTPKWKDGCQITKLRNRTQSGTNGRTWRLHGHLPYVDYSDQIRPEPKPIEPEKKSKIQIVKEVCEGKWGNYPERKTKLEAAGYDYRNIQTIVNAKILDNETYEIALDVIIGLWGNGDERVEKMGKAGVDYRKVQDLVNEILL